MLGLILTSACDFVDGTPKMMKSASRVGAVAETMYWSK